MGIENQIFPDGFCNAVREFEKRRRPFKNAKAVLPKTTADLSTFFESTIEPLRNTPDRKDSTDISVKQVELQNELAGQSKALLLNALLIAILRRIDPPQEAVILFHRLWTEHGDDVVRDMPVRWMISSATTFADHGETPTQRSCGMGLSVLFDMIKLHESERLYSGISGRKLFRKERTEKIHSMPFGVARYSFKGGDLEKNMLARLWVQSEGDDTIRPLAQTMIQMVLTDTRTVFSRLQHVKAARAERRPRETK